MALVASRAHNRVCSRACAALASIALGAGISVVADCPICLRRIRANTCGLVTRSLRVTLVTCRAHDRATGLAVCGPVANFRAIAGISIGATRPSRDGCMHADPIRTTVRGARIRIVA
jgi:hypothetical protein